MNLVKKSRAMALPQIQQVKTNNGLRAADAVLSTFNDETRTMDVVAATEYPVLRYDWNKDRFFNEILSFKPEHVRMGRVEKGLAPVLDNHDRWGGTRSALGVVESGKLVGNTMEMSLRFSKKESARETVEDIKDGILKGVSIGYRVYKYEADGTADKDGIPNYRAVDWEPIELSIAPVPADPQSGARSQGEQSYTVEVIDRSEPAPTPTPTPTPQPPKKETEQRSAASQTPNKMDKSVELQALREQKRAELAALSAQNDAGENVDATRADALTDEITALDARIERAIARENIVKANAGAVIDKGERQEKSAMLKRFDIAAAISDVIAGRQLSGVAGELRMEAERELKAAGQDAGHISIPSSFVTGRAGGADDFQAGSGDGSGFVETIVPKFIAGLTAPYLMETLGATMLPGLVGNLKIPRESVKATATEEGEVDANAASGLELDEYTMSPNRYSSKTAFSKQLLAQGALAVENIIGAALRRGMERKLNTDFFTGGGTNAISGLFTLAGVNDPVTSNSANHDDTVRAMIAAILEDHGLNDRVKWVLSPSTWNYFNGTANIAGVQALMQDMKVNGYEYYASPYLADASTGVGRAIVGDFSNILFGQWGGLDFLVDPYTSAGTAKINIHLNQWVDMIAQNPEAFAKCDNITFS